MNKSLLISNYHCDFSGGGHHTIQLLFLLSSHFDIYSENNIEYYNDNYWKELGYDFKVQKFTDGFTPEIHLLSGHRQWISPKGKYNIQLCFFPVEKKYDGWNNFIACNDFVEQHIKLKIPSANVYKIPIYFENNSFFSNEKKRNIITIGNYFEEQDGHSKNQHLIIDWFKKNKTFLSLDKLILHGFSNDQNYINKLLTLCDSREDIILSVGASRSQVLSDLASSYYLLHANGFNRTLPEQTEHFGMVAVEALLSGTLPIVHNSGGCKDILGVQPYNSFSEINLIIQNNIIPNQKKLSDLGKVFSKQNSLSAIDKLVTDINNRIALLSKSDCDFLNLGCGNDYREGFINLDIGNCRKDIEHDLEDLPLPFLDNSFSYILLQQVIEHIKRENFPVFIKELHRISKPNSIIDITSPYYKSKNAFTDFTHKNFMTEDSFGYFDPSHSLRSLGVIYGINFEFTTEVFFDRPKNDPEANIHFRLRPLKQQNTL